MIRNLRVHNFRSIRELDLPLRPFNCLVGPNNVGKSNLMEALACLRDFGTSDFRTALSMRGAQSLKFYGAGEDDSIDLEVEIGLPVLPKYSALRYRFAVAPSGTIPQLEALFGLLPQGTTEVLGRVQLTSRPPVYDIEVTPGDGRQGFYNQEHMGGGYQGLLRRFGDWPVFRAVRSYIQGWEEYSYVSSFLKRPGPAVSAERLDRDGANFASYLHSIHSGHRKFFNQIEEQLIKSFPEVEELLTPLTGNSTSIGVRERWYSRSVANQQLSDGLVDFLAHLVVMYGPSSPTLVCFEEPENHIHASLMEKLVAILKDASKHNCQIFITTHSTTLLNQMELEDVILVERNKGATAARRADDVKELVASLKGWAIGDAYASGLLGGAG